MLSLQNLDVIHFEKSLYIWIEEEKKTRKYPRTRHQSLLARGQLTLKRIHIVKRKTE